MKLHLAALLAAIFILGGCTSTRLNSTLPVTDIPDRVELEEVPFFSQRRQQCGAAALATVLAYRGAEVTAAELEPLVYIPGREGSLAIELVAQARQHQQLAYPLEPALEDLLREVAAGNPVLVMQNLGLSWLPQWHFAVVVGFDQPQRTLVLRSGNDQRRLVAMKTFLNTWGKADYWGRVILSPDRVPASAQPLPYLRAAADLEELQLLDAAAASYRAALAQWPDDNDTDGLARLGLGNIAYSQQQYQEAIGWFQSGRGLQLPQHWNNLAYSLQAAGCGDEARRVIGCAVAHFPGNGLLQESATELQALTAGGDTDVCRTQVPANCTAP
ncbi:PA2778 family cysteine peptidase [Pseudomaricurvus sp. HS19]|uniref:PA2778 family cysteine peptidase n=1 Tax=Pseudomaricurvus sp. HS19 TaxID=2692626 RepID=UPI00136BB9D8|nr:PA2778 family cysteine peptidase [Pseudomaricurvus sp. HS19]MYM61867.1 PA2778 family cysteine peptidase [Pseudomaricurvus sp. HS19]